MFTTVNKLTFRVTLPHLHTDLRRSDKDFDLLHFYLIKTYPNVVCAPIKVHKPQKANASRYINKRAVLLTKFLRHSLRSRILRGDQYLTIFLTETDEKAYKQQMKQMELQK
jgi:hypothetical protein